MALEEMKGYHQAVNQENLKGNLENQDKDNEKAIMWLI